MNRWIKRIVTFASLAGTVAALPAGVAFAQTAQPPREQVAHGKHHRMHRAGLLGAAMKLDSLTPEQKSQIEQLIAQRRAANVPVRQADAQVLSTLAQQVEAAKADEQALAPSLAAERAASLQALQVDRATLAQLHAILTPAQRSQLVDKIEARGAAAGEKRGAWKGGERMGGVAGFGRLGLSPEQKAQVRASLRPEGAQANRGEKFAEMRAERRAALESFRGDSFDPSAMIRPRNAGMREVRVANAMIPVLTPNQRATFAQQLRNRAAHESRG